MPAVLLAAGIGLIIGILQAVTQVQEQTIAAAPKILGVFLLIILGGSLMMTLLSDYIREAVYIAFNEVPQMGTYVLPPKAKSSSRMKAEAFFRNQLHVDENGKAKAFFDQKTADSNTTGGSSSTNILNNGSKSSTQPGVAEQLYLKNSPR
ncbi:MAG: flagellar biosynthetic protein FliQ [Cyanobacteria bacterium]|nr:flagellar biosynthetic protein FliQ [Cyanobacteriota bacterium]